MLIARTNQRKAAPVAKSWQRLEKWLAANLPDVLENLQSGYTKAELNKFEKEMKVKLPPDVRESFLIHNGQQQFVSSGVIINQPLDCLDNVQASLKSWRYLYEEEQASDHASGLEDYATSFPVDAIQCEYATSGWIPLGDWDGNCYGVDLNPGPNGVMGQVINFGRDEDNKFVLALSWAHFLQDVADELEAGYLQVTFDDEGRVEGFGRPGKNDQALFNFYREWSEAKLPRKFQNVKPAPKQAGFPGKVAPSKLATQAKELVDQFVQAMHDYEMKWLEIRPIHKLGYSYVCESKSGHRTDGLRTAKRHAPTEKLDLHKHRLKATREHKAIIKKFGTSRKRDMVDAFTQSYPVIYDPERDRVAEVRKTSPEALIVYMEPVDGVTVRFHLKQEAGQWRIDLKDKTADHLKFEKRSL